MGWGERENYIRYIREFHEFSVVSVSLCFSCIHFHGRPLI